jgi:cytochrome c oxidase cbb3-type subunit III
LDRIRIVLCVLLGLGALALAAERPLASLAAQQGPGQQAAPQTPAKPPGTPPAPAARPSAYPVRAAADPAVVQRGRQIFSANCSFCHGSDARGGEGGPNLIRSELVLNDKNGELIATVVQNGRPDKGMPKFDLSLEEIASIAAFIHSMPVGGRAETTGVVDPLVGDAKAGEAYFNGPGKCASCHSVSGDLAGIGAKYADVRTLQGAMLSGGVAARQGYAGLPESARKTVTVTMRTGETVKGQLDQIDDFTVALTDSDGNYHSYVRHGDNPRVTISNPLQPHFAMLRNFKDEDIHNLTAYLVTLK